MEIKAIHGVFESILYIEMSSNDETKKNKRTP